MKDRSVLLLSGGIDSTTTLALLHSQGHHPACLVFDYGQTLRREIDYAVANAGRYRAEAAVIEADLRPIAPGCSILGGSPIVGHRGVDEIASGSTPTSYVPFRNGILLAYAVAYGESRGLDRIYCGGNGLNSGNYWDDTAEFASAFEVAARSGTSPDYTPTIRFPMARRTKADAVRLGLRLKVDYAATWSCYRDGVRHCGSCDSCVQRMAAFRGTGLTIEGHRG